MAQRQVTLQVTTDSVIPNDPDFDKQWGLTKIEAPKAWAITKSSPDIIVAVLDTGIQEDHPDLGVVASKNFTTSPDTNDVYGHGTHVAGIIGATTDNGIGIAGLGFNCSLMNVKVIKDNGYCYASAVRQGIRWAVDNGAKVINLSLVCPSSSLLENEINYAWDNGATLVASAGETGDVIPDYPARYENVIAVAATFPDDRCISTVNYGDVAAPGVGIWSTTRHSHYGHGSGGSFAAPFVSGLAALLFAMTNDNTKIRQAIMDGAEYINDPRAGAGRINAYKSMGRRCEWN